MAYIGRSPTPGEVIVLNSIESQFNGVLTTFNLTRTVNGVATAFYPISSEHLLVSLGGVIQEPESAYQINESQIIFATAPQASDDFFCVVLGVALGVNVPANSTITGTQLSKPFNYNNGHLYFDSVNNRLGINSTSPAYTLDVGGDLNFSGLLYQGGVLFTSGVGIQSGGVIIGTGVTSLNFIGIGNTFKYNVGTNSVDISISGGGTEETTAVSSTSATSVLSFAAASYRSASILAQITQGSAYQAGRYLLIHDGTTVTVVEESSIATGSMLGSFNGAINGSNVEFRVTMSSASAATIVVKSDKISI